MRHPYLHIAVTLFIIITGKVNDKTLWIAGEQYALAKCLFMIEKQMEMIFKITFEILLAQQRICPSIKWMCLLSKYYVPACAIVYLDQNIWRSSLEWVC